jgi:hypothetical protein
MFSSSPHHQNAGRKSKRPHTHPQTIIWCNICDVGVTQCFERLLRVFYAFRKSISGLVSTKHFVNTERTVQNDCDRARMQL